MPNHVQSPRAVPFLSKEYELLFEKLEDLTAEKITDSALKNGIDIIIKVRRVMKGIFEFRKQDSPPITGTEAMYMICSQFFTDAREWLRWPRRSKKNWEQRQNLSPSGLGGAQGQDHQD